MVEWKGGEQYSITLLKRLRKIAEKPPTPVVAVLHSFSTGSSEKFT
jgi:hypothetical protein